MKANSGCKGKLSDAVFSLFVDFLGIWLFLIAIFLRRFFFLELGLLFAGWGSLPGRIV